MIHTNSILSRRETEVHGRRLAVLNAYKGFQNGTTDRDIMHVLGFNDPNKVRPRITSLIEDGFLVECGNIKCPRTNRTVRVVKCVVPERLF